MDLKKFKEENKRKKQIIIFTCSCVFLIAGVLMYRSFALFETKENFNIVSGDAEEPGDISFAFYINDEIILGAPKKDSGLALDEKSSCTNGVNVSWNVETWISNLDYSNYKQENTSKVKCNLYFRNATFSDYITSCGQNNTPATECMKKYSNKDTINLIYDETTDNNLRYIGATPNNYIDIGDRDSEGNTILWRVIGVMENIDNGTGEKETRLKIIRDESIGNFSWDSSASTLNMGYGVNEWSQADAMKLMNPGYESESVGGSLYWNRQNGQCYTSQNNTLSSCDFRGTGLSEEAKKYIENAVWTLGTYQGGDYVSNNYLLTGQYYVHERSDKNGKICTSGGVLCDTLARTTKWTGKIGLMYPSDYGYATSGGQTTNRSTCLSTNLYNWGEINSECKENSWLFNSSASQWTMTPSAFCSYASGSAVSVGTFVLGASGHVSNDRAMIGYRLIPTAYLKSTIKLIEGRGTKENPFRTSEKI